MYLLIIVALAVLTAAAIYLPNSRFVTVQRLKRQHHNKPEYDLCQEINPLEYELLLFGSTSMHGVIAVLLDGVNRGLISLERSGNCLVSSPIGALDGSEATDPFYTELIRLHFDQPGRQLQLKLDYRRHRHIQTVIELVSSPPYDVETLSQLALDSLKAKGLVSSSIKYSRLYTRKSRWSVWSFSFLAVAVLAMIGVAVWSTLPADLWSSHIELLVMNPVAPLLLVAPIGWLIHASLIGSRLSRQLKERNHQLWQSLYSLYIYFEVSGADIFNLDYSNLHETTTQLTPYYVAARLTNWKDISNNIH